MTDKQMIVNIRYQAEGQEKSSGDPENDDFVLLTEISDEKKRTRVTIRAKKEMTLITCSISKPYTYRSGDQLYLNGYQSWTDTREYDLNETIHNINRIPKMILDRFHFASSSPICISTPSGALTLDSMLPSACFSWRIWTFPSGVG